MAVVKRVTFTFGLMAQSFFNGIKTFKPRSGLKKPNGSYDTSQARVFSISTIDHQLQSVGKKLFKSSSNDKLCKWCNKPQNIKCRYAYTHKQDGEELEEEQVTVSEEGKIIQSNAYEQLSSYHAQFRSQ